MFVLIGAYQRPVEEVKEHHSAHRGWIQAQYEAGNFLVSGPLDSLTGGVIVTRAADRAELDQILSSDPYVERGLIRYEVTEFRETDFPTRSKAFDTFVNEVAAPAGGTGV